MGVCSGDRYFNSFEELGQDILKSLPKERQRVKWWRLRKPALFRHQNCMAKGLRRILVYLPRVHTSRSWVGYFWIHLFLFNRWCVLFQFGHWEKKGVHPMCKVGKHRNAVLGYACRCVA